MLVLSDWIKTFSFCIFIYIIFTSYINVAYISGNSMQPTFYDKDIALLVTQPYYEEGDVVGFNYIEKDEEEHHIKRVVASPGDTVVLNGVKVYVNDELIIEDGLIPFEYTEYKLGDEEYFVMGDNYGNSFDSRFHGPIKKDDIIGKVNVHYGHDEQCNKLLTFDMSNKNQEVEVNEELVC